MDSEFDILVSLYTDIFSNIEHINMARLRIQHIKTNIKNLNNNYFETKCNEPLLTEYLTMFDNEDANNEITNNLETLKLYIKNKLENKCQHEWVKDLIDIDPDRSQHICYCVKCEVTKK